MAAPRRTIAIIDDDTQIRKALGRLLRTSGYQTLSFASAAEFLHSTARDSADCLLIDIHLGSDSGLELASHPLVTVRNPPIIFISAIASDAVRKQALKLGIACLGKPCCAAELLAALSVAGI